MKKIKLKNTLICTLTLLCLGAAPSLLAKSMFVESTPNAPTFSRLFILLGTGGSFSQEANISANPAFWDPAIQGYNSSVGSTVLYTAGVGYQFSPLVNADIEVTRRPSYSYSKFQTPAPGSSSTPGFLGTKTRKFELDNTSVMANFILNGSGMNIVAPLTCNTFLQPFVGGGIGVAYNTVSNFHSVLATSSTVAPGEKKVSSVMDSKTRASFAWQFIAGAELLHAQTWGMDLGYRYFNGGSFISNNYFINDGAFTAKPWRGTLKANEVFFNLKYFLA